MNSFRREFYATREDLLPAIERLEAKWKVQYVQMGMFHEPEPPVYVLASVIEGFGTASDGSSVGTEIFLVMDRGSDVNVEEVPQKSGGVLYLADLSVNPTAFAFTPGGTFGERVIIRGSIDTATADPTSLENSRRFWRAVGKSFVKAKRGYYVGPNARRLLEEGWRLTGAVQSPPEMDLPPLTG